MITPKKIWHEAFRLFHIFLFSLGAFLLRKNRAIRSNPLDFRFYPLRGRPTGENNF
jgi:hypothetical protein